MSVSLNTNARYFLPRTPYFQAMRDVSLGTLAGYAEAERRYGLVGNNLFNLPLVAMSGPLEYSPYGAALVERVRENPSMAGVLCGRWNQALVASPATAILGLRAGPVIENDLLLSDAAAAIMYGKAKYFALTAGVSTTPLTIRSYFSKDQLAQLDTLDPRGRSEQVRIWRAEEFARTVRNISGNFGFINIEDSQGRDLALIFSMLEAIRGECTVWSDDRQGTGVVTAAGVLAWAEVTNRDITKIRGVICGAGAGARGVYDELVNHGVKPENILVTDRGINKDNSGIPYPLYEGRDDVREDPFKAEMTKGIPEGTIVEGFLKDADFVMNLGDVVTVTRDPTWTERIIRGLSRDPLIALMTNPSPGYTPEEVRRVRSDAIYASGNQIFQNVFNNFAAFGLVGGGAMIARAGGVNAAMTVAAARGILQVAKMGPPESLRQRLPREQREFGRHWLVANPFDSRLIEAEAGAVARAAIESGISTFYRNNDPSMGEMVAREVAFRTAFVEDIKARAEERGHRYYHMRHPERYAPFSSSDENTTPDYYVSPEVDQEHFEKFATMMGVKRERWQPLLDDDNRLKPTALTIVLDQLKSITSEGSELSKTMRKELQIILYISSVSPAMGLALALRRTRVRDENLVERPTVFHREVVLRTVVDLIPEAHATITAAFPNIPELAA